ncbi:MAG: hypothetical protein FWE13_01085 [Firmicutes bacterium]|nr:hypothetical protein [Bacillota bacterium]
MKKQNSKFKKIVISIFILAFVVVASIPLLTSCANRNEGYTYALSRNATNRIFQSLEQRFSLPTIVTDDQNYTVVWSVGSSSIANNPVAILDTVNEGFYSLQLIDVTHNITTASTTLIAIVTGTNHTVTLYYTVTVRDISTDHLSAISSSKHGNINYTTRGIARTRVFGLYDIQLPECGTATPGRFEGNNWVHGTWQDVTFTHSSSTFLLMWNYRGEVDISVWIEEQQDNGTFIRLTPQNYSPANIARVVYNPQICDRTVTVNFLNPGIVRVVAESAGQIRPGFSPRYEFTYEIIDAVNTYDFDDIKLLERLARYTYITEGVEGQMRGSGIAVAGASARGRSLGNYINSSNYNGLLSLHFNTTPTPTPSHYIQNTGSNYRWDGFDDVGEYFIEFAHWAPSFRFRDIVIRSTHRDLLTATRYNGRMETWAEGTWFFGSVFGNGFHLDATPYTRSEEGRYRNVHSMRGLPNGDSIGFESRRFFPGYGWGDLYAFYMLANNSILDNITLTGENIPQGATAIRLNQYHKIGVIGTSMLAGMDKEFSIGRAHNNGVFTSGLYIEGITIQNSIIEKGLTLVGAGFAPNANNPITINTSVLRFGGFTGVLGVSYGGGIGQADPENGEAVRTVAPEHSLSVRNNQRIQHPNEGSSFGNFIISRNNIFHDISVSPLLTMPSRSGSHISIEGNENHFFTWLRSNDIQFPEMTDPNHEGFARIMGGSINGMIPALMNRVFTNNNGAGPTASGRGHAFPQGRTWSQTNIARYEQPNGVFLVNIPVIIVTDEGQDKNNYVTFANSVLATATETAVGLVSDHAGGNTPRDLNQRFDLIMLHSPNNATPDMAGRLIRIMEMNTVSINERIINMVPAGTRMPTFSSGTIVELTEGFNTKGEVVLFNEGLASFSGHRIFLGNREIESIYNAENRSITMQFTDIFGAGVDGFGAYEFSIINMQSRSREPVSRFSMIFGGGFGGNPSNVVPGSIGFSEANRYIEFPINLSQGNVINSITIAPDIFVPIATPINFSVQENGVLSIAGAQLRNGDNTLIVSTNSFTVSLRQSVIRYALALEAMPVDLVNNPNFIINLIGNVHLHGLGVNVNGQQLLQGQFTVAGNTIIVPNAVVRQVLGDRYMTGTTVNVIVTNDRGLHLTTQLQIIAERIFFSFGPNAITTPLNTAAGIEQPFINIAPGHNHFTEIHIELTNFVGYNILGISFADTNVESEARREMIRLSEMPIFRIENIGGGVTRLVVPASIAMGLTAGTEHRIWVFTPLHSARTLEGQYLRVFNGNHDDGLNRAPNFIADNFIVDITGNVEIGFASNSFAFLLDLFASEIPDTVVIPDEVPFLGGTEISLSELGIPELIDLSNYADFSYSTFSSVGTIFAIRNASGQLIREFSRNEIVVIDPLGERLYGCDCFDGNNEEQVQECICPMPLISFITSYGGTRSETHWVTATITIPIINTPISFPIPIPMPVDAFYVSGFTLSQALLAELGLGEFTIEVRNNYNIALTSLTIIDL